GGPLEPEFLAQVGAVRLDRLDAAAELGGDLGHRQPLADHAKDFEFAIGKIVDKRDLLVHPARKKTLHHDGLHAIANVDAAVEDLANRDQQLLGSLLLHQIALGPGTKRAV